LNLLLLSLDDHHLHNRYDNQDSDHNKAKLMDLYTQYLKLFQDPLYHKILQIRRNVYDQKIVLLQLTHTFWKGNCLYYLLCMLKFYKYNV
jgi:hypothetical protein